MIKENLESIPADTAAGEKVVDTLKDEPAILKYLIGKGWKITKSTLNRHKKQCFFRPLDDGSYSIEAINKYAERDLKKKATGKKVNKELDELLKKKADGEVKYQELKQAREQFNFDKDKELYIRREQVEIELASRAGILVAGLKHWIQSKAAEWIAAMNGDSKRVGELINIMGNDIDEHINHYASNREYEVVIDAAEENELETEEVE
jgi:hypothetical protein